MALLREAVREDVAPYDVTTSSAGRYVSSRRWLDLLAKEGLGGIEEGLSYGGGERLRRLPDRENVRIRARGYRSGEATFYMKRFVRRRRGPMSWIGRRSSAEPATRAAYEWENGRLLGALGVSSAEPAALGEAAPIGRGASFVVTEEVTRTEPLDDWLASSSARSLTAGERRDLVRAVAWLAGTLHRAGGIHKDLYLCHILIRKPEGRLPELTLIDLDRMRFRDRVRVRWFVKDIAALYHSSRRISVSRSERLRFLREYLRCHPLAMEERRFARRVLSKAARMAAHVPRNQRSSASDAS